MTVEELVSKTKMMLAGVQEQMKQAEITGTPPEEIPGAEHDKPIPADAEKSDPQVTDGSMGPTSAYTEGGEEQKNEPVGELFEADEPVLNPEKKPEESADANAKTAGADVLANSLLEDIKAAQAAMKEAAAKTEKKAEIVADKETQEVTEKPEVSADANADAKDEDKGGEKETVTADTTVTDTTPEKDKDVNTGDKQASDELQLTTDLLAKLACYMLAEEEGADLAERVLAKVAGDQAAKETMDFLEKKAEEAEYWDSWVKGAQAAEALMDQAAEAQGAADAEALIGDAAASDAAGAADAEAALAGADAGAGEGGEDGVTPEEFVDALESMVQSGEITEDQAMEAMQATGLLEEAQGEEADEDIEIQQLAQEIQTALDSGALTMDQAQALVQELSDDADAGEISELQDQVAADAGAADAAADAAGADASAAEAAGAAADAAEAAGADTKEEPKEEPKADATTEEKAAAANDIIRLINKIRAKAKK